MYDLIKKTRDLLLAESSITAYVGNKIYMAFKPIVVTPKMYPQITLQVDDGPNYRFLNVYMADLYLEIWNKGDGAQTENTLILKEVLQLLNQKRFDLGGVSYKTYRYDKQFAIHTYEEAEQVYRVNLKMKVITTGD